MNPLQTYVHAWRESAREVQTVCESLTETDWARPTDCPGWSVQDVLAHLAAVEAELVDPGKTPRQADGSVLTAEYTELGVAARRDRTPHELLAEFTHAVDAREATLAELPADPKAPAAIAPGDIGWDWETLLRNRTIDVWTHEQDIRRAVDRPGNLGGLAAQVTTAVFAAAMGYVLGKKVAPPVGTRVVWEVIGAAPFTLALGVGEDGRAHRIETPQPEDDATEITDLLLTMDLETFNVLAAGRRDPADVKVRIAGDRDLARAVLSAMAVTP